jgi:hypothetical protein
MGWEQLPPETRAWHVKYSCENCERLKFRVIVLENALKSLLPHVNETSPIGQIIKQALEVKHG